MPYFGFLGFKRSYYGYNFMNRLFIGLFQIIFFQFQPTDNGFRFSPVEATSCFSRAAVTVDVYISFGREGLVFYFVTFFRKLPAVVNIIIAIGNNGIYASSVFGQKSSFFTFYCKITAFTCQFHYTSGRRKETIVF